MGDTALARQIGHRLRERRTALGMTPEELARTAGISTSALEEQEAGRVRLSAEALLMLAEAMGVPLRHLFETGAFVPAPEPLPPPANAMDGQARALLDAYVRISHPDLRRAALVSVEALARLP
jgi:transcriptional regulator with XRE-family HTH domain